MKDIVVLIVISKYLDNKFFKKKFRDLRLCLET